LELGKNNTVAGGFL